MHITTLTHLHRAPRPRETVEAHVRAHECERLIELEKHYGLHALRAWRADYDRRHTT